MNRTHPLARAAFVAAITQDTPSTDLPRFVAVLGVQRADAPGSGIEVRT